MYIFPHVIYLILGIYALIYFFYKFRARTYALKYCKYDKFFNKTGYSYHTDFGKFSINIEEGKFSFIDKNGRITSLSFNDITKIILEYSNNPSINISDRNKLSFKPDGRFYWYNIIVCDQSDNLIPLFTAAQYQPSLSWRIVQVDLAMLKLLGWYDDLSEEVLPILEEILQDFKEINSSIELKRI